MPSARYATVDEYIAAQPPQTQEALRRVRRAIRKAIPQAAEVIAYNMPAYKLEGGTVLHFAASKNHYALYGATEPIVAAFKNELRNYEVAKGTIRFRLADPVPEALIQRIALFRAEHA